jgi:hypothetical protein
MDKAEKPNDIFSGGSNFTWNFDHSVSINHFKHSILGCLVEILSHYMFKLVPPHEMAV